MSPLAPCCAVRARDRAGLAAFSRMDRHGKGLRAPGSRSVLDRTCGHHRSRQRDPTERGEESGSVNDLIMDDRTSKVRFLHVSFGGFRGLGQSNVLIPIDALTHITFDAVHVDHGRAHRAGGTRYHPALTVGFHSFGITDGSTRGCRSAFFASLVP